MQISTLRLGALIYTGLNLRSLFSSTGDEQAQAWYKQRHNRSHPSRGLACCCWAIYALQCRSRYAFFTELSTSSCSYPLLNKSGRSLRCGRHMAGIEDHWGYECLGVKTNSYPIIVCYFNYFPGPLVVTVGLKPGVGRLAVVFVSSWSISVTNASEFIALTLCEKTTV